MLAKVSLLTSISEIRAQMMEQQNCDLELWIILYSIGFNFGQYFPFSLLSDLCDMLAHMFGS